MAKKAYFIFLGKLRKGLVFWLTAYVCQFFNNSFFQNIKQNGWWSYLTSFDDHLDVSIYILAIVYLSLFQDTNSQGSRVSLDLTYPKYIAVIS